MISSLADMSHEYAGGDRSVKAIDMAFHGDVDSIIALPEDQTRDAFAFIPDHDGQWAIAIKLSVRLSSLKGRPNGPISIIFEISQGIGHIGHGCDGNMVYGSSGNLRYGGIQRGSVSVFDHDPIGPKGVGAPQDGS